MHTDARNLPENSLLAGDLCIIGAGAAGISMALDWDGRREKVILLEGGGFEYDDQVQDSYAGTGTGQKYYPLKSARLHYFGGTTGHWGGMCSPYDPIDFRKRPWVPHSGWPITKKDLDPYYQKAQRWLYLGPYEYGFDYWKDKLPDPNPFPFDPKIIWNKMWQHSKARFGRLYRDAIINSKNISLHTYANAVEILAYQDVKGIREVLVKTPEGKTHRVRAKRFVLACGAIQNARLLLASNRQASAGLGNKNDLVGRYFQEHLEIASAEFWLNKPFRTDLYAWEHNDGCPNAELAFSEQVQEEHQILNGTVSLMPLNMGRYRLPKMQSWKDADPRAAMDSMTTQWDSAKVHSENPSPGILKWSYQLNTRIEQAPNPDSRITLDRDKDAYGLPRATLHWSLTGLDKKSIRTLYEILGRQAGISGLGRIRLDEWLRDPQDPGFPDSLSAGWHHMGTTRMSRDPKSGVVDANCRVHGLGNLYVAGSACYPTSGAANPTLTLVALSLRLSDHLKGLI